MIQERKYQLCLLTGILLLIALLSVGCRKPLEEPRQVLTKAIEKSLLINTSEKETNLELSITLESEEYTDPQTEVLLGLFNRVRLWIHTLQDIDDLTSHIRGGLEVSGILFPFEIYSTEKLLAVNVPGLATLLNEPRFQNGYVVLHIDEILTELDSQSTNANRLMIERLKDREISSHIAGILMKQALGALSDEAIEDLGEKTIDFGDGQVKVRQINLHLNETEFRSLGEALPALFLDPDIQEFLFEIQQSENPDRSREVFQEEMDEFLSAVTPIIEKGLDHIIEQLDMEASHCIIQLSITDEYRIIRSHWDVSAKILIDTGKVLVGTLEAVTDIQMVNEPVTVEIPEFNKENTIDLMELLWLMMFAF